MQKERKKRTRLNGWMMDCRTTLAMAKKEIARLLRSRWSLAMTHGCKIATSLGLAMTYRGQLPRPLRTNAKCKTYNHNV